MKARELPVAGLGILQKSFRCEVLFVTVGPFIQWQVPLDSGFLVTRGGQDASWGRYGLPLCQIVCNEKNSDE